MHKSLTHVKCGFTLCILYVRNGERYGGLWICACEHRRPILVRPISRAKNSEVREDISREDQRCSFRPQAADAPDGGPGKGGRVGSHPTRSIGEVHTRSPQSSGNDRRERGWVQIAERYLG